MRHLSTTLATVALLACAAPLSCLAASSAASSISDSLTESSGSVSDSLKGSSHSSSPDNKQVKGEYKVIDMARTALNVTGQLTVPALVARSEGLLDEAVFNGPPRELTSAPSTPDGTDAAGVDEQAPARDRAAEPVPA